MKKEKVNFLYSKKKEALPTGTCLILVTPDSEKEQCAHILELLEKLTKKDLDIDAIKKSEITFLEGYLWDEGDPKKTF